MVWRCFHREDIGPIIKVEGTIDRFLYREILQTHMLSYAEDNLPVTWVSNTTMTQSTRQPLYVNSSSTVT